jgi:hypothetical protein
MKNVITMIQIKLYKIFRYILEKQFGPEQVIKNKSSINPKRRKFIFHNEFIEPKHI